MIASLMVNKIHYVVIFLTIFFLSITNVLFALLFVPLIYYWRKEKVVLIIGAIVLLLTSVNLLLRNMQKSSLEEGTYQILVCVDKVYKDKYYVWYKQERILIWDTCLYKPGDYISVYGTFKKPSFALDEFAFNYQKYLHQHQVFLTCYSKKTEKQKNGFSIHIFSYYISKYIESVHNEKVASYINALVLGNKDLIKENQTAEDMSYLGISHLFAISGLHISLIVIFLTKLLSFCKKLKPEYIIIPFLLFLLIITGFTPSVLRATLLTIFGFIVKRKNWPFDSLDILSFIFVLLLVINPYFFSDVGFQLSFLVAFSFILSGEMLNGGYLKKTFKTSILAIFITIPIVSRMSGMINIMSVFANCILIFFFSYFILTGAFLSFIIPPLGKIYLYFINIFEFVTSKLANIDFLVINIPYINSYILFIFYFLFYYLMRNFNLKRVLIFGLFFIMFINFRYINPKGDVYIFDVGQGDTSLISLPFNKGNMVIDCYKDGVDRIIQMGVNTVDYLVITHGHDDHMNSSIDLINRVKVNNIVCPYYDLSDNLRNVVNYAKKKKIPIIRVRGGDYFYLNRVRINVLLPKASSNNLNNLSVVLTFALGGKDFLFMGDMEDCDREIRAMEVDYLKVGHHGSKTATNDEFLKKVSFNMAIISVGYKNKFGLPDEEVIQKLEEKNAKIHITYEKGTFHYSFWL